MRERIYDVLAEHVDEFRHWDEKEQWRFVNKIIEEINKD